MDNHGNILREEESRAVQPGVPVVVDVEKMSGYVYPPNIVWEDSLSDVSLDQETKKLNLTPNLQGGTVTITYTGRADADETYWPAGGRICITMGRMDPLAEIIRPLSLLKSQQTIPLAQVTEGLAPTPSPHYSFDGWHRRLTSNGSGRTGSQSQDEHCN
ncbi:MAG: hypothetical protein ACLTW9_26665 [Enterocloster sp.]